MQLHSELHLQLRLPHLLTHYPRADALALASFGLGAMQVRKDGCNGLKLQLTQLSWWCS